MAAETKKLAETPGAPKTAESMQQTIDRVIQDGVVTKEELGELLSKYEAEKAKVTAETKTALDGLIKESVATMLKNGFTLDSKSLPLLQTQGYDCTTLLAPNKTLKDGEKVTVTLDAKDPKKVVLAGIWNDPFNDDKAELGTTKVLDLRKSGYIDAIASNKGTITPKDLSELKNIIASHPDKGVREDAFERAIMGLTGSKEKQNIVTRNEQDFKDLNKYLEDIVNEADTERDKRVLAGVKPTEPAKTEVTPIQTPESVQTVKEATLAVGKLGELKDGAELTITAKKVNFREEPTKDNKGKDAFKIHSTLEQGKNTVKLDIAWGRKEAMMGNVKMIPVKFGDKSGYVAEKYLAKKEETAKANEEPRAQAKEAKK